MFSSHFYKELPIISISMCTKPIEKYSKRLTAALALEYAYFPFSHMQA